MTNGYLRVAGYPASQERLGRGDALGPMWGAWAAGDRKLVPDDVVDQLFLRGDAARPGLERYAECGATTTVPALDGTSEQVYAIRLASAR